MESVKPFVKWAGGKGSLIPQLKNFYPLGLENETINKYVEPFVGGGAVLINILQKYNIKESQLQALSSSPRDVMSSDCHRSYFRDPGDINMHRTSGRWPTCATATHSPTALTVTWLLPSSIPNPAGEATGPKQAPR